MALPLYSFWHMDDFSWGNTRVVTGDKGNKVVVSDEGKFDPSVIPHKRWEDYQTELWEAQTATGNGDEDTRSQASGISYTTKSGIMYTKSEGGWGGAQVQSYALPRSDSQLGFHQPPSRPMSTNLSQPQRYNSSMSLGQFEMTDMQAQGQLPSDDSILAEIRDILRDADLVSLLMGRM